MNFDDKLTDTIREMASSPLINGPILPQEVISAIDLTRLDKNASESDIHALAVTANQHHVAAICVLPIHLAYLPEKMEVKRTTVINFPDGNQPQQSLLKAIDALVLSRKVDEIDYVFPYQDYLAGKQSLALSRCHNIFGQCKKQGLTFKVILETGAFPSNQMIYDLSLAIIKGGCDFLKTSTGKITVGATIPAVFSMLAAIRDSQLPCGIKISGGIKTLEQALAYMRLTKHMLRRPLNNDCFRLGASSLLDALIRQLT